MKRRGPGQPRKRRGPRGKFAELLRSARAKLGVSQVEAAKLLGVASLTIARWETGWSAPRGLARRFAEDWCRKILEG